MAKPHYRVRVDWNHGGVGARSAAADFTTAIDDITSDVRSLSLSHNRDLKSETMESAVLSLELNNQANYYSPTNASSALTGLLLPGKPVWVQLFYPYDSFGGSEATLNGTNPDEDSAWSWVNLAYSGTPGSRISGGFEEDGSGNARIDVQTGAGNVGNHISYLEFNDQNVQLHAKITTPDRPIALGSGTPATSNPAYYTSHTYHQGVSGDTMVSMFGFVIRYTDVNNYQAVGFDAVENANVSATSREDRNDKVFLLTYSTDRTIAECTAAATTVTAGDGGLYKVGQHILVEREIMQVTSIGTGPTANVLTVTRGMLGTAARVHGSSSSTTEAGPFKAPLLQWSYLKNRHSTTPVPWLQGVAHEVQIHARGHYIDVTFDGAHCPPNGTSNSMFEFGSTQASANSLYGGMEADSSHTFKTEASASTGTKHGMWRSSRAAHSTYYGQSGDAFIDGIEIYQEFGGYRSLFSGYLSSITPDPDPLAQYCYVEAYDETEIARRTDIQYAVSDDVTRVPIYPSLIEILYVAGLYVFSWTSHTNFQATNIIYEPMLTTSGPYSGATTTNTYTALKKIDTNVFDLLQIAQAEEDGFFYVDGEGFLRLESQVHRSGAGVAGVAPETWTPFASNGDAHTDAHGSLPSSGTLTGHVAADHILYGQTTSNATYAETYGSNNPAYTAISYSDGHEFVENRIHMPVTSMEKKTTATTAFTVWTSKEADDPDQRIEIPNGTSYLLVEMPSAYETVHTVAVDHEVYTTRTSGSDVTSSVAVTQEKGVGDPQFCAFKFKFVSEVGAASYMRKFEIDTGTSNPHGGYKQGAKNIVEATDSTSVTKYGERKAKLKNLFITSPETGQITVDVRLARKKDPRAVVTLSLAAGDAATLHHMLQRRFSDRVIVQNANMGMTTTGGSPLNKAFYVEGETWDISEGGTVIEQQLLLRAV